MAQNWNTRLWRQMMHILRKISEEKPRCSPPEKWIRLMGPYNGSPERGKISTARSRKMSRKILVSFKKDPHSCVSSLYIRCTHFSWQGPGLTNWEPQVPTSNSYNGTHAYQRAVSENPENIQHNRIYRSSPAIDDESAPSSQLWCFSQYQQVRQRD